MAEGFDLLNIEVKGYLYYYFGDSKDLKWRRVLVFLK